MSSRPSGRDPNLNPDQRNQNPVLFLGPSGYQTSPGSHTFVVHLYGRDLRAGGPIRDPEAPTRDLVNTPTNCKRSLLKFIRTTPTRP